MTMTIRSSAFGDGGDIPVQFTCDGDDHSPPLQWSGVPSGAKSLVLIVDDPDAPDPAAPRMTWVHWVLYNLPASDMGLAEAVTAANLPRGTHQGLNDWERTGYGGPCPPTGKHRYFFKLYALDTMLPTSAQSTKKELEQAMSGHVLAEAQWIGRYERRR